jgi:hypothetical protein
VADSLNLLSDEQLARVKVNQVRDRRDMGNPVCRGQPASRRWLLQVEEAVHHPGRAPLVEPGRDRDGPAVMGWGWATVLVERRGEPADDGRHELVDFVHRAVRAAGDDRDGGVGAAVPDCQVCERDMDVLIAVDRQGWAVGALGEQVVHRQRLAAGQELVVGREAVEAESVADDACHAVHQLLEVVLVEGGARYRPADDDGGVGDFGQSRVGGEVPAEAHSEVPDLAAGQCSAERDQAVDDLG